MRVFARGSKKFIDQLDGIKQWLDDCRLDFVSDRRAFAWIWKGLIGVMVDGMMGVKKKWFCDVIFCLIKE